MDFFNGNNSGSFGSFPLRLRFAYVDFGPFRLGQATSTFMDPDAFPNVLDYQGPNGMVLMRQPIFSLRFKPDDHWRFAIGVEQPYSDIEWFENGNWIVNPGTGIITDPTVSKNIQDLVDFTGHARYEYDYGHMQAAGILRKLSYQPVGANNLDELGYGVNFPEIWRRAAYFIDRIFKGAKPGELPVEQPARFELAINVKAAKALGIRFPDTILVRAERVIE